MFKKKKKVTKKSLPPKNILKKKKSSNYHKPQGILEKIEHYNTKLINPALVLLLVIILVEVVPRFRESGEIYHTYILIADYVIIAIFVIDLIFLAIKAKSVSFFFKNYWLDILAIFPLTLAFTFFTKVFRLVFVGAQVSVGQAILHETLRAKKGIQVATRSTKILRFVRIGARSIRIVTKSHLFSKFETKHHLARRKWKSHKRKGTKPNIKKRR